MRPAARRLRSATGASSSTSTSWSTRSPGRPSGSSLRAAVARELLELGTELGDPAARYRGHLAMVAVEAQVGTRPRVEHHIDAMVELDRTDLRGTHRRVVGYFRAGLAQLAGDLGAAEVLLAEAAATPSDLSASWDVLAHASVLLPVRREQGRLGELHEVVAAMVLDQPDVAAWRAVLAASSLAVGDLSGAEREIERSAAAGFGSLPEDVTWMAVLVLVADTAVELGRLDLAESAAALLRPYSARACYCGHGMVGPVGTTLARVDGLAGRIDDAMAHLAEADAVARRLEAPILAGHVAAERALLGLPGGEPADLEAQLATAEQHGWVRLAERLAVACRTR